MPRQADPAVREQLLDTAAQLLVHRQPVSLRRVAAEAGTSTMAIYTHFGGMEPLMSEVRQEGFRRLGERLAEVSATSDPVADVAALGWGYCLNALEHPSLYRAMFFEATPDTGEAAMAASTFLPVVDGFERAARAGRITVSDTWTPAVQLWAFAHGAVSLCLGGMLTTDDLVHHLEAGFTASLIGLGDKPTAVRRSVRSARRRMIPAEGVPAVPTRGVTAKEAVQHWRNRQ